MTNEVVLDLPIQNERSCDARGGLANPPQNGFIIKAYFTV
jgi:hypothetical protein